MSIQTILTYLNTYGYLIIYLFIFFGIVGIPAPEESLLFLIGLLTVKGNLHFGYAILSAISGAFSGMLIAYILGKYVGYPFINKYGRYIGITTDRVKKVQNNYAKNIPKTILLGFYMPGLRQASPYFAGLLKTGFPTYFLLALSGSVLWTVPYAVLGYYSGMYFNINPNYVPYLGVLLLLVFILYLVSTKVYKKIKLREG